MEYIMKQLIFTLGFFASTLTFPSAPTPHVSQAVGLDADVKSAAAHAESSLTNLSTAQNNVQEPQKFDEFSPKNQTLFNHLMQNCLNPHAIIKHLLKNGLTIDSPLQFFNECPMIVWFALHGNQDVVQALIKYGANSNVQRQSGDINLTPLVTAARSSNPLGRNETMKHLLLAGADVNVRGGREKQTVFDYLWPRVCNDESVMCTLIELSSENMHAKLDHLRSCKPFTPEQNKISKKGLDHRELRKKHLDFIQDLQSGTEPHVILPPLFKIIFEYAGRPIIYSLETQTS